MATDVPKFLELYCGTPDKQKKNEEQCTSLAKIQVDILRLKAQKLVEIADKANGKTARSRTTSKRATRTSICSANTAKTPIRAGQPAQAEHCDDIIYNAAKSFQQRVSSRSRSRHASSLLDPRSKMDKTRGREEGDVRDRR